MKKRFIPIISAVLAVVVIVIAGIVVSKDSKFVLSDEMYDGGKLINIEIDELRAKVDDHKSFALLVSQPGCRTADDLRKIVREFSTTHHITIYEVDYSGLKESGLVPGLKFYPSFVVFKLGRPVDFLAADSNEDAAAYTSYSGFETWFTDHITLRD